MHRIAVSLRARGIGLVLCPAVLGVSTGGLIAWAPRLSGRLCTHLSLSVHKKAVSLGAVANCLVSLKFHEIVHRIAVSLGAVAKC